MGGLKPATVAFFLLPLLCWSQADSGLRARIPLGMERLQIEPNNRHIFMMATAESPEFENWVRPSAGARVLYTRDGTLVRNFPRQLQFRVTATTKPYDLVGVDEFRMRYEGDLNQFILGLKFRLRIFRELDARTVEPSDVTMLGVPADTPYDERIWRVSFEIGEVPVDDKVVLEVLSPEGERLSRFHLAF